MDLLVLVILVVAGVSHVLSIEAGENETDQQHEGSIAHPKYSSLLSGATYNHLGSPTLGGGGLVPPPPLPQLQQESLTVSKTRYRGLTTSQAQSKPVSVEYSHPQSLSKVEAKLSSTPRRRRKQRLRNYSNFFPEDNFPERPPIPQEPDIPSEEEPHTKSKTENPEDDVSPTDSSEGGTVYKHISVHVPPEDLDEDVSAPNIIKVAHKPEKHLRVIFIKPEADTKPPKTEVQLPPGPIQRTVVYVLSPSGLPIPVKLVKPSPPKPIPPQVFFLRYKNPAPEAVTPSPTTPIPDVEETSEKVRPRINPTLPPPIKIKQELNSFPPTPSRTLPIHSPPVYTFKTNYKIINSPDRYRVAAPSTSSISHIANNINNNHLTPLLYHATSHPRLPYSSLSLAPPPPLTPYSQNYFSSPYHHHHHHLYSTPIVTSANPFPHFYPGVNYPKHPPHPQYFPVINTRFIYSCTLFERR